MATLTTKIAKKTPERRIEEHLVDAWKVKITTTTTSNIDVKGGLIATIIQRVCVCILYALKNIGSNEIEKIEEMCQTPTCEYMYWCV